jgi:hypothetical protein
MMVFDSEVGGGGVVIEWAVRDGRFDVSAWLELGVYRAVSPTCTQ